MDCDREVSFWNFYFDHWYDEIQSGESSEIQRHDQAQKLGDLAALRLMSSIHG